MCKEEAVIGLSIKPPVAVATLRHPPVNAIDDVWVADLNRVLDEVERHNGVSVLHIRSAHAVFCAGADLGMVRELLQTSDGRDSMIWVTRSFQEVFSRLEKSPLVTVAEIGGAAMGGGLELALACDLRVAGETVKLGLPEARLGLLPAAGGTQRMSRVCGDAVARRLILGAEVIDGREALRLGLVQWAVPMDELAAWTRDLIDRLAALSGPAIAACKRCIGAFLDESADGFERELIESRRLHDEAETRRRVLAFLER